MDGQEKASWRYKWIIKAQMAAAISGELGNAVVGPLYGYLRSRSIQDAGRLALKWGNDFWGIFE